MLQIPRPPFWIYIPLFLTVLFHPNIFDKRDDFDFDISVEMAWTDKTRHKMFKCSFYNPSVLYKVDFGRTNKHTCKTSSKYVVLLTSSLSSSPAIVRNASILNLPKFVLICWC